jgi:hypothetical protein
MQEEKKTWEKSWIKQNELLWLVTYIYVRKKSFFLFLWEDEVRIQPHIDIDLETNPLEGRNWLTKQKCHKSMHLACLFASSTSIVTTFKRKSLVL